MKKILLLLSLFCITGCASLNKNMINYASDKDTAVVCIGMQTSKKYGNCPGAQLDATRMYDKLKDYSKHRTLLVSQFATKAMVVSAMQQACQRDLAIIFYSGHGEKKKKKVTSNTMFVEPSGYDSFLCLYDAPLMDDEIWSIISNAKGRVILITDACHSATMYRDASFMNFEKQQKNIDEERASKPRILAVGGCADTSYSYGGDDGGLMTNAILLAWRNHRTYKTVFNRVKKNPNVYRSQTVTTTMIGDSFEDYELFR